MFWADEFLQDIKGDQVINDSFTPSGMVHMGSLKGPVIHDALYKVLKEKGISVTFKYGFDDMDVIDGLAPNLQESHSKYMGVPLFLAPAPEGSGSFADYFRERMQNLLEELDIHPTFYRTSELYNDGTFNRAIRYVLDHASKVRNVYSEIYKKQIPDTWYPVQVICPNCGKLGTTKVTGWNNDTVTFACEKNLVKWAEGCDYTGEVSPFDGGAKMPWKVEWAAKWWTFPVTIEGAGKDHASAGGSYDVAMKLVNDVFGGKQPQKLAYEFFLSGGKKMSSSKGLGITGEELLEVLGPQRSRFLMIKSPPNQAVEFTPRESDSISKVFDDYQHANKAKDEKKRAFELAQVGSVEKVPSVRFTTLAQWVQMPNMEAQIKKEGLEEWAPYAKVWIEKYAPESEKFEVKKELPEIVNSLSSEQRQFLATVAEELHQFKDADELHKRLYEVATGMGLSSKDAFSALYKALIGKDHGPKAAWLIISLDDKFVKERFLESSK